jgi:hypothetical protein
MPGLDLVSVPKGLPLIEMKAVLAGDVAQKQLKAVRRSWKKGLLETRNQIRRLYKAGTETWEEHHPRFYSKYGENQSAMWVDTWTTNEVYWFVHESVSRLRAVFTTDWHPKTRPGRLASTSGRGRMLYASKKIDLDPYEARKFTDKIIEVEKGPFQKRMENATQQGAQDAQRGGS